MTEKKYITQPLGKGFYRLGEDQSLTHAVQSIIHVDYTLHVDQRDQYQLPIDGWYYFDDEHQARAALGLPPLEEVEE